MSDIQKNTYQLVFQLYGYIHNDKRFTREKIINKIMYLQTLLLEESTNQLDIKKIFELRVSFKNILYNETTHTSFNIDPATHDQIYNIFDQITNELSAINYLNERELFKIINKIVKHKVPKCTEIKRKII